ncbi:unnamed protein product [Bursaphelenchus xylophilus]|uniref:(pine wood nematode) hypothetical protein n=1 Tax=Bursaphelenchus xylophilus TaxID=6326 RepID=A0A7I8WPX4_BURXY|nr:unnamed protein product [Bursaphelenchus xylophilus]CAG9095643.1 unnamed protein product [Bursaphelenchus xylophilus]
MRRKLWVGVQPLLQPGGQHRLDNAEHGQKSGEAERFGVWIAESSPGLCLVPQTPQTIHLSHVHVRAMVHPRRAEVTLGRRRSPTVAGIETLFVSTECKVLPKKPSKRPENRTGSERRRRN